MPKKLGVMACTLAAFCFLHIRALAEQPPVELRTGGGIVTWSLNIDALQSLGLDFKANGTASKKNRATRYKTLEAHASLSSGFVVTLIGEHLSGFRSGWVELHDGPIFTTPTTPLDLTHARLRPLQPPSFAFSVGDDSTAKVWLIADHPHYGIDRARNALWIKDADLRVGPDLAQALRHPEWTGIVVGRLGLDLPVESSHLADTLPVTANQCATTWPSKLAKVDLAMIDLTHDPELGGMPDTIATMRCAIFHADGHRTTCTSDSTNGRVVFAPDAALKNVGSAAIAWHPMFTGNQAPYGNDQHPYLIWNLYRIDTDGRIRQIGRSGVKHAYYADNFGCNCPHGLASYPGCMETYASGTNDMLAFLGPREEIIPASGQWARCGSVFDPQCRGRPGGGPPHIDDGYERRLAVLESDLLPSINPGARYLFEYGYIVRDDIDVDNSFAYRSVTPAKTIGANAVARWSLTPTGFDNGFAIDAWVDPHHPTPTTRSTLVSTAHGHARIAVRVTALGDGRYRYDYAVLNEDFANVITEGKEPDLRIKASGGFDRFRVPRPQGLDITDLRFADADSDAGNDWSASVDSDSISWTAQTDTLTWGTLYAFGFTASAAPTDGNAALYASRQPADRMATFATIVPR